MATAYPIQTGISISLPLQRIIFFFVWMTFFLNAFVIREPAPCDLFMMAFIVVMPLFGLVRFTIAHIFYILCWLIVVMTGLVAAWANEEYVVSFQHMMITGYLAVFSVVLAGFITKRPGRHFEVIWNGYLIGAVIAAMAGIIGYLDLIPGAHELFTKYSRARGTFKDPNVYAPYLVPAFLYCLHILLTKGVKHGLVASCLILLFLLAILMSFSRGAWGLLAISTTSYITIFFFSASSYVQRVKTLAIVLCSFFVFAGVMGVAIQSNKVQSLLNERISHSSYDLGDNGRFSAHKKAADLILEKPLGVGALYFGDFYHHELPHNLYLSMFLSSGWIGGTIFILLMLATLAVGFVTLLNRTPWMNYHVIIYSAFIGLAIESYIIDSDHWRQLYILMGLIWGFYAAGYHSNQSQAERL